MKLVVVLAAIGGLTAAGFQIPAGAAVTPAASPPGAEERGVKVRKHDFSHPLGDRQRELRRLALEKTIRGETKTFRRGKSKVVKLGDRTYAQVSQEKTDRLFTIITEFGEQIDPRTGGAPGPLHNEIPEPDRRQNNSTAWQADYDRAYFKELFFARDKESMANFYSRQSQGRYTIDGDVSDWVKVPFNEARYGSNAISESDGYWNYVKDTAKAWYDSQVAAGKTPDEIKAYLETFDKTDRYDYDADGNFDEPDGYIDHFQAVHAGEGEEAGGGAEGEDAIWSHRWFAFAGADTGPAFNRNGGVPLGDSGIWIGDYTTEPENGGLGVFVHEYGHDLGLPDEYDTSGKGDNGTGFWTLMSSGSWLNHGGEDIGTSAGYMNSWDKIQLGWLDYTVVAPTGSKQVVLGPAAEQTDKPQAIVVPLPKKKVTTEFNKPFSGSYEYWGGSGDALNTQLKRTIDLTGKTSGSIDAKAWYDTEEGFDYLRAEVSTDGGTTWEQTGDKISGTSDGWVDLSYDLSAYAGKEIVFRYRYTSDGGIHGAGPMLDDVKVKADGAVVFEDDIEQAGRGWSGNWTRFGGTVTELKGRYYLAENRQYIGYDETLETGPYNFNRPISKPDWVERYPYQNGLLVHYWNEVEADNNTNVHPGKGLILPVDARPAPIAYDNGTLANGRAQSYDATFGVEKTDELTLSREVKNGNKVQIIMANVPSSRGIRAFDDSKPNRYWSGRAPQYSVKVAGFGVRIEVLSQSADAREMTVRVSKVG